MGLKDETQPTRTGKRHRALISCTECHRRKQKCNRSLPCNDCSERKVPYKCRYESPAASSLPLSATQHGNLSGRRKPISSTTMVQEFSKESIAELADTPSSHIRTVRYAPDPEPLSSFHRRLLKDAHDSIIGLPTHPILKPKLIGSDLEFHYVPLHSGFLDTFDAFDALPHSNSWVPRQQKPLITYFVQRLAPWLSQYEEGLHPTSPRLSWLPESIDHPPLFHATLLCAAVHLDRVQPRANPQVAIWFKAETLRLLNESLSNTCEGASDRAIIVALILLYFNVGGGDPAEYETHLNGINLMLRVRGGIKAIGLRGIVKNWLAICHGPWSEDWEYGHFLQN